MSLPHLSQTYTSAGSGNSLARSCFVAGSLGSRFSACIRTAWAAVKQRLYPTVRRIADDKSQFHLLTARTCNWRVAGRNDHCNGTLKFAKDETVRQAGARGASQPPRPGQV